MGSPDPLPRMEFERVFPDLKFVRPVMPTNAGDGTDRLFVVTQDGLIHVFPNRHDVKRANVFLDLADLGGEVLVFVLLEAAVAAGDVAVLLPAEASGR